MALERKRQRQARHVLAVSSDVEAPHPWAFLAEWRDHLGYTMRGVADRLGTTQPTLHRWEHGLVRLPVQRLLELAKLYGAESPSDLNWPPQAALVTAAVKEAVELARKIRPRDLESWLQIGRSLALLPEGENSHGN